MYNIFLSKTFEQQSFLVIDYYKNISDILPKNLKLEIMNSLHLLSKNPELFRVYHKDYRRYNLKTFPYCIIYKVYFDKIVFQYFLHQNSNTPKNIK
jgi:hypothetical protein